MQREGLSEICWSQVSWQVFSDFLSLAEILCLLIHLNESSVRVCLAMVVYACFWEMVEWEGGQRKQDANESVLINVCLISYSVLSGHGRAKAEEHREQEESVGRSSWESAGPTSDSLPVWRTSALENDFVNADVFLAATLLLNELCSCLLNCLCTWKYWR